MTLGEKIRTLRKKAGLSQEALAEKLGVSRQAVSKWENDNGMPETEKLITMAKLFDTSLDDLIGEEKSAPTSSTAESSTQTRVDPAAVAQLILAYAIADPYRALRHTPLALTPDARTELTGRFTDEQPKLQRLLFCGIFLVGVGFCLAPLLATNDQPLTDDLIFAGGMIFAGAGAYLCIYTGGLLRTYRQLLETEPLTKE